MLLPPRSQPLRGDAALTSRTNTHRWSHRPPMTRCQWLVSFPVMFERNKTFRRLSVCLDIYYYRYLFRHLQSKKLTFLSVLNSFISYLLILTAIIALCVRWNEYSNSFTIFLYFFVFIRSPASPSPTDWILSVIHDVPFGVSVRRLLENLRLPREEVECFWGGGGGSHRLRMCV